ncbi:MAG: tetratricopeptide repeat protein, partial [Myxococcota bacterium]|nr:tetratricopeptide repeat protein [Myxococcota bacterium]
TGPTVPARRPVTTPPPPPAKRTPTGPVPTAKPVTTPPVPSSQQGPDSRSTGLWANEPVKISGVEPSSPFVGKLSAIPDEPAFAGRVRVSPSDESSFDTGRVRSIDDDDDMLPARRGSRAGLVILVMMLLVGAGAAAIIYLFVLKKDEGHQMPPAIDAGVVDVTPDATMVVTPVVDAAPEAPAPTALETARAQLAADHEVGLRASLEALPKDDPATQIMRAHLGAAIAQALMDRAGLVPDKTEADKLRKEAKTIVLDAATAAQRAHKATPDDAGANLAMANVLRLQGKPAKDLKRYSDVAKTSTHPGSWARDAAYADALVLARDGKLDDAKTAFAAIDQGDGKLEVSNDVRARFHLALVALAQNRAADAKALADQVLAAQPEHAGARALVAKLETKVSNTDPLPPEEPGKGSAGTGAGSGKVTPPPPDVTAGGGSYDQLLARANKLAEGNCTKALELYAKALEQKPNGVEALTGMGYCHIDAKQFASAFSKFRAALAVSPRFEPALWGVAEAYQQQGRREQALEAYRAYLEVYPDSAKAKKQVDRLGGGATPSATPPEGSGTTPTPTPTPTPPTPTPTPEAPGSGSG